MMLHQHLPDPAYQMELWQSWYPEFTNTNTVLMYLAYGIIATLIGLRVNQVAPTELLKPTCSFIMLQIGRPNGTFDDAISIEFNDDA